MEKFNSIAHCSRCDWAVFFYSVSFWLKTKVANATKTVMQWQSGFRVDFLFSPHVSSLLPPSFRLESFLLSVCCRTFPMIFQYLFSKIPFYSDRAETKLRQFPVKLQWNLQSDCIRYHAINTQTPCFCCALFSHSVILIQSTFDSE